MRSRLALALLCAVIAGCAGPKKPLSPADELWSQGNEYFDSEAYDLAIERYKALLDQHPFDANAEEAELRIARAYYLGERYPEAISSFSDFERMHPTSPSLPYVEYHLGQSYAAQASTSDRDQQSVASALTYFKNVVDRFPQSEWTERARLRIRECRESLAEHEGRVAAFYLRRSNLKAAESRLAYLLTEYPDTMATAETLHTFGLAYLERGEEDGARLAFAAIVQQHSEGPLAEEARDRLGPGGAGPTDALAGLRAHLAQVSGQEDRLKLPTTVSAYPNSPASR